MVAECAGLAQPHCITDGSQNIQSRAKGPTSGFPCVWASAPSSAATPRVIAAISLPA